MNGKGVDSVSPRGDVPVLLFIVREAVCLWFELFAARKHGKRHGLKQRRDNGDCGERYDTACGIMILPHTDKTASV